MRHVLAFAAGALLLGHAGVYAQTAADSTAVRATALDYIEGWYEGNAERMGRALHPNLAKRIVLPRPEGAVVQDMTAEQLVAAGKLGERLTHPYPRKLERMVSDCFGQSFSSCRNPDFRMRKPSWLPIARLRKNTSNRREPSPLPRKSEHRGETYRRRSG